MKVFQSSRRSIVGALLLFLLHGSCAGEDAEVVHKAVGDSLDFPANHPKDYLVQWKYNGETLAEYSNDQITLVPSSLFPGRIKTNNDPISIKIEDLKHLDSGNFTIVAHIGESQPPTKLIVLHVHNRVKNVKIEYKISRLSKNCTFYLHCETLDDLNSSYNWSSDQGKSLGQQLNISLHPAESSKVSCTADNTVSQKSTEKTLECTEESKLTGFRQELWLTIGISILAIVILSGIIIACFRWRKRKGQTESEAGITVYEDVNPEGPAKKRTESVVNGMSIYETVDDIKVDKNLPQTIYDKLSYQRHPTVTASTSSPYQEVL